MMEEGARDELMEKKNEDFRAKPFGACLRPPLGAKLAGILVGTCRAAIAYTNCPFF